jgi:hypothetical protein
VRGVGSYNHRFGNLDCRRVLIDAEDRAIAVAVIAGVRTFSECAEAAWI